MRLSPIEKKAILDSIKHFDSESRVFLYGSRANPNLKGGDIDLIVFSDKIGFSEKVSILINIKKIVGEQKIDLLVKKHEDEKDDPFVQSIMGSWIELIY